MHCSEYAPNVCCKFYPICSEKCQCQCALLPVILALKSRYSIHLFEFEKRALTHSPTCEQALKQWKARIKNRFLLINDMNMCAYRMLFSIGFILFHFRFSWVLFFLHFSPSLSVHMCVSKWQVYCEAETRLQCEFNRMRMHTYRLYAR